MSYWDLRHDMTDAAGVNDPVDPRFVADQKISSLRVVLLRRRITVTILLND